MNEIRTGYISSVNTAAGMVRVTYPDRDQSVTAEIPYFNQSGEYMMPQINELVLVVHVSNDSSMAVALGTFWNLEDIPTVTGENVFHKKLSQDGKCSMQQVGGVVTIEDITGSFTVGDILKMQRDIEELKARGD